MKLNWRFMGLLWGLALGVGTAHADGSTLDINQSLDRPVLAAFLPPQGGKAPEASDLISKNLVVSGLVDTLPSDKMPSGAQSPQIQYQNWQLLKVEYLIKVQDEASAQGRMLTATLWDVFMKKELAKIRKKYTPDSYLRVINTISNQLFKSITGIEGVFNTRVAYVTVNRKGPQVYRLIFSYLNGSGEVEVLRSSQPILSLSFSPNGRSLAYVSFESSIPTIFLHELSTGKRQKLQLYHSSTSAPRYSPDGKSLAFAVTLMGQTDIYTIDLATKKVEKLTSDNRTYAISTEPTYAPDGSVLAFTTDRYGASPQIAELDLKTRAVRRLTQDNFYTAGAKYLNRNELLLIHQGDDRIYSLYRFFANIDRYEQLTFNTDVESFSLSPNREYVIYTETNNASGSSVLKLMHLRTKRTALLTKNNPSRLLREAVWSPLTEGE